METRTLIQPEVDGALTCAAQQLISIGTSSRSECKINNWASLHAFWQYLYQKHLSKNSFLGVLDSSTQCFYYQEFIFRGRSVDDFFTQQSDAVEQLKKDSGYRPADCIIFRFSSGVDGYSDRNVGVLLASPNQPLPPILQYIQYVVCLRGGAVVLTFQKYASQHNLQVGSVGELTEKKAGDVSSQHSVLKIGGDNLVSNRQTFLPMRAVTSADVGTTTAAVPSAVGNAIALGGVVAQPPSSSWTLLNMMCRPEVAAMSGAFLAFGLLTLATGGSGLVVAGGSSLFVKIGITSSVIGGAGLAGHFFAKKSQLPSEPVAHLLPPPPSPPPPPYSVR